MIIKSLLDTDLYKFTMQYVVFKKFPDVEVTYSFKNRTKEVDLKYEDFVSDFYKELKGLTNLKFKREELDYLQSLGWFSKGYLEYLKNFKLDYNDVFCYRNKNGNLDIVVHGTWLNTILFEVPLLAIVSELYTRKQRGYKNIGKAKLEEKLKRLHLYNTLQFSDFGTRRRFSRNWQDYVIKRLANGRTGFVGTSNVYLAKKYKVKPIGTMAHEFIQASQSFVRLSDSQKFAFQTWADVYRGNLGIALSDTLGMDAFFKDFDMYFSKLFDGARHDSGDPEIWCDKLIKHYENMKINPLTKTAVFSDGLNVDKMIHLHSKYVDRINVAFGIGTNLTNDCGIKPLQIVIKMTRCDGKSVAKISDSPGKQMCEDKGYLKYLATVFNIPEGRI